MLFFIIIIISAYICYKDIAERRIPNVAQYFLLITGMVYQSVYGFNPEGWYSLTFPVAVLVVGILLSRSNIIGFGDIKLIFSTLLLVKSANHYAALMFIVLSGGGWAIMWHFIFAKLSCVKKIDKVREGIPYGIPIILSLCIFTYVS